MKARHPACTLLRLILSVASCREGISYGSMRKGGNRFECSLVIHGSDFRYWYIQTCSLTRAKLFGTKQTMIGERFFNTAILSCNLWMQLITRLTQTYLPIIDRYCAESIVLRSWNGGKMVASVTGTVFATSPSELVLFKGCHGSIIHLYYEWNFVNVSIVLFTYN